ncbi:MAG: phosphotransferase enzyme family protein, partial [Verrucomicrobiales bacterium]
LPGERLHETVPDFHHARKRYDNLMSVVELDPVKRADSVREEIEFVAQRENVVDVLLDLIDRGELPERITHNDTKLNNVMIDDTTGKAICVVDLDTVMPGSVLYDFGDMVRTATSPALEDERDLSLVTMQLPMFDALVDGYWSAAKDFLTPIERDHLAFSGKLLALMIGIRFLTDHIEGDVYFKTHRKDHNLDRARNQFKLVSSMEEQEEEMHSIVAERCV